MQCKPWENSWLLSWLHKLTAQLDAQPLTGWTGLILDGCFYDLRNRGGVSCSDAANSGMLWKHGLGSGRLDWCPGLASWTGFLVCLCGWQHQPVNHPKPLLITFFTGTKNFVESSCWHQAAGTQPLTGRIRYDLPVPYDLPGQETYL